MCCRASWQIGSSSAGVRTLHHIGDPLAIDDNFGAGIRSTPRGPQVVSNIYSAALDMYLKLGVANICKLVLNRLCQ